MRSDRRDSGAQRMGGRARRRREAVRVLLVEEIRGQLTFTLINHLTPYICPMVVDIERVN